MYSMYEETSFSETPSFIIFKASENATSLISTAFLISAISSSDFTILSITSLFPTGTNSTLKMSFIV